MIVITKDCILRQQTLRQNCSC